MLERSEYQLAILKYPFRRNTVIKVEAVAGSGKSTTMVELAYYLSERKKVRAEKQRLITFSNKSARDLQKKINTKFKGSPLKPQVSTLHGFAMKIIKDHFNPNITVLTQWQSVMLIRSIMEVKNLFVLLEDDTMATKTKVATEVYKLLDYIKANVKVNGSDYYKANFKMSKYRSNKVISDKNLSVVLKEYEAKKNGTNMFDYSDLIYKSILLLEAKPEALEEVRKDTKVLYGDEAQDLALADITLMLLISQKQRLVMVGDVDQTIYGFRYADPTKFSLDFLGKYFDNTVNFPLPINYRSTANIVKLGNVIRKVKDEKGLQGIPFKKGVEGSVQLQKVANTIQEGLQVSNIIDECIKDGYRHKEIVIIARTNAYLKQVIEPVLVKKNIPYQLSVKSAGKKLNERTSNLLNFNLLQLAMNPENLSSIIDLAVYINGIGVSLQQEIAEKIMVTGSLSNISLGTSASKNRAIQSYLSLLKELKGVHTLIKANSGIAEVMESIHRLIIKYIKKGIVTDKEQKNIGRVISNYVSYYQQETDIKTLDEMLNQMLLEITDFTEPEDRDVVSLSTVHSQKGLSNKVYIACGFVSHRRPKDLLKDEINILYVQMSRAEERQYIVYSDTYINKNAKSAKGCVNPQLIKTIRYIAKQQKEG